MKFIWTSGLSYGEIPRFIEELAYLRGLNVRNNDSDYNHFGQLKKVYRDNWESVLDCVDTILFLGSNSKETLEYIVTLLGKKTWYKKSTGRTFSRQGSSSTNWDIVGRELATLDELSQMQKGYCILFIATVGAFYSKLYDLKEHPDYSDLYEPWANNKEKLYDHHKELCYKENDNYKLLCDCGLYFAKPLRNPQIEEVNSKDLKEILKNRSNPI